MLFSARLAETAVRFLDQTQNMVDKEAANINYETELSALHEMVGYDYFKIKASISTRP